MNYYGIIAVILSLAVTYHLKPKIDANLMVIYAHHKVEQDKSIANLSLFKDAARQKNANYDKPIALLDSFYNSQAFDWRLRNKIKSELQLEGLHADFLSSNYTELNKWLEKKYFSHGLFQHKPPEDFLVNYSIKDLSRDSVLIQLIPVNTLNNLIDLFENDAIRFYENKGKMSYHELINYSGNLEKISVKTINSITCEERSLNFVLGDD